MGAGHLDGEDVPDLTTGQAAELLGARPAFLRRLEAGGVVRPHRSAGGHRRWTRSQLALAGRVRALFDEGYGLVAAARVVSLQDQVAALTQQRDEAQDELARAHRETDRVRRELAAARRELTARAASPRAPTPRTGDEVPTSALRPPRIR